MTKVHLIAEIEMIILIFISVSFKIATSHAFKEKFVIA